MFLVIIFSQFEYVSRAPFFNPVLMGYTFYKWACYTCMYLQK